MLVSNFRRGPHTAQSTIKALSELPHHTGCRVPGAPGLAVFARPGLPDPISSASCLFFSPMAFVVLLICLARFLFLASSGGSSLRVGNYVHPLGVGRGFDAVVVVPVP